MTRDSIKFRTGKYIGLCPEEVLGLNDSGYLQWIATLDDYSDKDLLNHVRVRIIKDTEMQFGKFLGTRLNEINPTYLKWLKTQMQTNTKLAYLKYV